jgi:diguanylate cyclase (GGDEF)-like protein
VAAWVVPVYLAADYYDFVERIHQVSRSHAGWHLDELITEIVFFGLAGYLFAFRRLRQYQREILRRRLAEDDAHHLARHDALTGLPNRRSFLEQLGVLEASSHPKSTAVFIVDLDHFKPINDLYGHRLGDEVLRVVAARIRDIVGDHVLIARLGGDEFGILMHFTSDDEGPSRVARRIVYDLAEPIKLAALSPQVGASVGIAIYTPETNKGPLTKQDGSAADTVMRQADMAMYRAKTRGGGAYHFFEQEMDEQLQQRIQLEREIRSAIQTGQIIPYYQSLIDLSTGEVIGFEILARWQHPTRGLLQPAVLIPIAEDTGTISEMTYALLRQAIADASTWPAHFTISINLSPRQFADKLLAPRILGILTEHSFPAHRLEIEITENALIKNIDETKEVLELLRKLGVRVALDDFGSGYSGLYHLRQFKLDTIKIDRSFVTGMLSNPEDGKLVEAIVSFSHALGLAATAEGIETVEVRDRLKELGCNTGQGFYYSEPQPYAEVQRYLGGLYPTPRVGRGCFEAEAHVEQLKAEAQTVQADLKTKVERSNRGADRRC